MLFMMKRVLQMPNTGVIEPDPSPALVTIPNVEIVSTGTYPLSTGEHTFTTEDLVAALGALDDPAVKVPRLKIGHTDPRFSGDGEPAIGKVENLHLSSDKQTLIGDYVGVPKWFAEAMASAYPSRSIEGTTNAKTSTGRTHRLVITAVSLLGTELPGVETLEDIKTLFSEEGPIVEQDLLAGARIVAKVSTPGDKMPKVINAAVQVDDVRRAYYESLGPESTWWWIRAIYLDPNELIVDDDQGGLYRVPFDVSEDGVTFDEPTEVQIQYVDVTTSVSAAKNKVTVFASKEESRPETNQEDNPVTDFNVVRETLGMQDASDDEVLAKIKELKASAEVDPEENDNGKEEDGTSEKEDEVTEGAEVPEGMKLVDEGTLEDLKQKAEMGVAARRKQIAAERESLLDGAIKAGKIPPSRKEHWSKMLEADEVGARKALDSLEAGLIPTQETGTAQTEESLGGQDIYPAEWLPEVQASNNSNRVTQEVV